MATKPSRTPIRTEGVAAYSEVVRILNQDARRQPRYSTAGIASRLERELPRLFLEAAQLLRSTRTDLLTEVLKPWCLQVAAASIGCKPEPQHIAFAENVFHAAAFPENQERQDAALQSVRELNAAIGGTDNLATQAFIAMVTSVPAFLASLCALLASHPAQWLLLQAHPLLIASAVEEGLRLGGLPAILFREGGTALVLESANRDPAIFTDPDEFRIERANNPHLAFGKGVHFCAGAHLVRSVSREFLRCLTLNVQAMHLTGPLEWNGVAMRYLEHLPVQLELCERAAKMTVCPPGSNTPTSRIP